MNGWVDLMNVVADQINEELYGDSAPRESRRQARRRARKEGKTVWFFLIPKRLRASDRMLELRRCPRGADQ